MALKLNRQQLNSTNWGSSVNSNWTALEQESNEVWVKLSGLEAAIAATELGVVFGGFLRFDLTNLTYANGVKREWSTLSADEQKNYNNNQSVFTSVQNLESIIVDSTMVDTNAVEGLWKNKQRNIYFVGNNGTMPLNRIFRVIGEWNASIDSEPPYNSSWGEGNICVYTTNGYTQIFWNDYIYEPTSLTEDGQLAWTYTNIINKDGLKTPFPAAMVANTVAYKLKINSGQWTDLSELGHGYSITVPNLPIIAYTESGTPVALSDFARVSFITLDENNFYKPFYVDYKLTQTSLLVFPENKTDITDNDYAVITYVGKAGN